MRVNLQQSTLVMNWSYLFSRRLTFIFILAALISLFFLLLYIMPIYLNFIQQRSGVIIDDPLLKLIHHAQTHLNFFIFFFTYFIIAITLTWLIYHPERLLTGIVAYILITLTRMLCIYLTPLDPPRGIIPIDDPIAYGNFTITKDLFFSGHMSTLMLCILLVKNNLLRGIIITLILLVITAIVLQKNHYMIDIVIAPYVSFTSYILTDQCCQWLKRFEDKLME